MVYRLEPCPDLVQHPAPVLRTQVGREMKHPFLIRQGLQELYCMAFEVDDDQDLCGFAQLPASSSQPHTCA